MKVIRRATALVMAVVTTVILAACAAPSTTPFPGGARADYQLGGAYDPDPGVAVVVRDSEAEPAGGTYSICYVNGFQTQPGVEWPRDLILLDDDGAPLVDQNWPDENIIDLSTPEKRRAAADRQFESIATCADSGFDAVEFDNLDSYTRSQDAVTLDDAIAFATVLVAETHRLGMAASQKNTTELGDRGRDEIGFDFAVVEECDQFDECGSVTAVYGSKVIDIEYTDALRRPFPDVCADAATPRSTILRDRGLSPSSSAEYVYDHC